tara:strand:+ start:194 stop:1171 length:978 start_codon:yes stop_codon:yes gene_type:complete
MNTNVFSGRTVSLHVDEDAVQKVALVDDGTGAKRIGRNAKARIAAAEAIASNVHALESADDAAKDLQREVMTRMDAGALIPPKEEAVDNFGVPSAHTKESWTALRVLILRMLASLAGHVGWSHMAKPLAIVVDNNGVNWGWLGTQFVKEDDGTYVFSKKADKDFVKAMGNHSRDDIKRAWESLTKHFDTMMKRNKNRLLLLEKAGDEEDKDVMRTYEDENGEIQSVRRFADPRVDKFHEIRLLQDVETKRAAKDDPVRNLDRERLLSMVEAIEEKVAAIKKGEFSGNTDKRVFTGILNNAKNMRGWIEEPASDAPKDQKHRGIRS